MSPGRHLGKGSKLPNGPLKGKLRLFSNRFCPYAQRVHLVLDAKKVPYDVVNIDLINKPEWLYEKSPYGKVPALEVEDGEIIYESLIIADYLDDKYHQNQLTAKDPLQKAKDRLLIDEFSRVIHSMYKILVNPEKVYLEDDEIIAAGLATFEKELGKRGSKYFGGEKPGLLDFMIWPWCERSDLLKHLGNNYTLKKDQYKFLVEWRTLMSENAAVKKSFLDTDTHTKFLRSFKAGIPDYDNIIA